MKHCLFFVSIFLIASLIITEKTSAQIIGFRDGVITWTNTDTNASYTVEWAPSLILTNWQTGWANQVDIPATTDPTMSTMVPMYYRVTSYSYQQVTNTNDLITMYSNAVRFAGGIRTTSDISYNLIAILTNNSQTTWTNIGGTDLVLVASFMSHARAVTYTPGWINLYTGAEAWVTAVPEVKNFCIDFRNHYGTNNLLLRLKQRLGLNPNWNNSDVVEYYVDPKYLIRPSPDIEVVDRQSVIDFSYTNSGFITLDSNYYSWYTNRIATVYCLTNNFNGSEVPWGRVGYTYDWALPNSNCVGFSEFVILSQIVWMEHSQYVPVYVTISTNATYYGQ